MIGLRQIELYGLRLQGYKEDSMSFLTIGNQKRRTVL